MKLFNKSIKFNKVSVDGKLPDSLLESLKSVRSTQDCLEIFEKASLFASGSLPENIIADLYSYCSGLRKRGMAMEPNLIGRAVASTESECFRAGSISERFGSQDTDVSKLNLQAEEARSKGNFSEAEFNYWQILRLYPKYPVYSVQYAHVLKEQGKFQDALVHYLNALAFGSPKIDVEEHAIYASEMLGIKALVLPRLAMPSCIICSGDLSDIYQLLFGDYPSVNECLELMLEYFTISSAIAGLICRDKFKRANIDLLRLVAETAWSPKNA